MCSLLGSTSGLFPWKVYIFQLLDHSPCAGESAAPRFSSPWWHPSSEKLLESSHVLLSAQSSLCEKKWSSCLNGCGEFVQARRRCQSNASNRWCVSKMQNGCEFLLKHPAVHRTPARWAHLNTMIRGAKTVEETQPTRSHVFHPLISAGEVANKRNTWRDRLLTHHSEDVV